MIYFQDDEDDEDVQKKKMMMMKTKMKLNKMSRCSRRGKKQPSFGARDAVIYGYRGDASTLSMMYDVYLLLLFFSSSLY